MDEMWAATVAGDVDEVERLVGQDPGLLNAKGEHGFTPLMLACAEGRVEVVRWLIDKGRPSTSGTIMATPLCTWRA
jgi:ankyrin repeat protein